jgi:hypothetical protein
MNPTSVWSYGYAVPGKQPFTLYNTAGVTSEGLACWWTDNWTTVGGVLATSPEKGPRVINGFHFAPGWLLLHPGPADQKAALRFTAPASGAVLLLAHFGGTHAVTSTDVHVMHGDRALFAADIRGLADWERPERTPQATASCTQVLSLTAGDTVDVLVGFGGDAHTCDYTAVRLIVTPLDSDLQHVTGAVHSLSGPLAGCRVDTSLAGQELAVQTDASGAFSLQLPQGKHLLRAAKAQYAPWAGEIEVGADGVHLPTIALAMRTRLRPLTGSRCRGLAPARKRCSTSTPLTRAFRGRITT